MNHLQNCPVCNSTKFTPFLKCKDFTVSGEVFTVVNCESCSFKFTNPRPEDSRLGDYYKSENYISHSNTKKGLVSRLYHLVRNYTLKSKLSLVEQYVSRGTLLDYGCGVGMFLTTCKKRGWKGYGMEPDTDARKIAAQSGANVYENKTSLAEAMREQVDAITLWHVLEHVTDLKETLSFFHAKLKNHGVLIIAVPNYTSYDAKYYREYWAAYDVPRHLYHFEVSTLSKLLKQNGFTLHECKPMKFDGVYVSMLSEKYRTGKINYISAFLNGLRSNLKAKSAAEYSSVIYILKKG